LKKDFKVYLDDMINAINEIEKAMFRFSICNEWKYFGNRTKSAKPVSGII
jgi:uncharacterized protein with HEPN domain